MIFESPAKLLSRGKSAQFWPDKYYEVQYRATALRVTCLVAFFGGAGGGQLIGLFGASIISCDRVCVLFYAARDFEAADIAKKYAPVVSCRVFLI